MYLRVIVIDNGSGFHCQAGRRVFNIGVEKCRTCGGTAKMIACIENPAVIKKILTHLEEKCRREQHSCCRTLERRRSPACSADSWKRGQTYFLDPMQSFELYSEMGESMLRVQPIDATHACSLSENQFL